QRVQDLVELAAPGLLAADPEQAAARQLLGQGAGALFFLARTQVDPGRARHAAQVDAMVVGEVAVLDRLQGVGHQRRHVLHAHQATLLLLLPVQRGDARGVQARGLDLAVTGEVLEGAHAAARDSGLDAARPDRAVDVAEAAAGDRPATVLVQVGARPHPVALAVGGGVEFGLEGLRVHRQPRRQPQRPRVDACGHLPAQLAETLADLLVEIQRIGHEEADPQADRRQRPRDQPTPPVAACAAATGIVVALVFVVLDTGHACRNLHRKRAAECDNRRNAQSIPPLRPSAAGAGPAVSWSCRGLMTILDELRLLLARTTGLARRGLSSLRTRGWSHTLERARLQFAPNAQPPARPLVPPDTRPFEPFAI